MAWTTVTKRRAVTFVPPEAGGIAASLRSASAKVRDLSTNSRSTGSLLDTSWEGHSKDRFIDTFQSEPGNLDSYSSWLESAANQIESITVTKWETYEETVWEHDPVQEGG